MAESRPRRARGEGSVYQDGSRWVGVADLGIDPQTRKRVRRKVTGKTKTEARQKLAELLRQARTAGSLPRGDLTVAHLLDDLLAHPPAGWKSPISVGVNTDHAKRIRDSLGKVKVTKLTVGQVEAFLAGMAERGFATATIRGTRGILRLALRRAERDHGLGRNVADLAVLPAGTLRKSRSMTPGQVQKLLALPVTPWWRAYFACALMLGLRPGELLGLTWEHADLDAGVVKVRQQLKRVNGKLVLSDLKTPSSRRTIEMPEAVAAALKAHRQDQLKARMQAPAWEDHDLVFCSRSGTPRWRSTQDRRFKELCERAGIGGDWQLRETRHTFVSVLSESGLPIEDIADAVGHVNSHVTRTVYRHQVRDQVAAAATAWDAITKAQEGAG
jgi:integrase